MPLSRRYHPEKGLGDNILMGFDFSPIIPPGVGIKAGLLDIFINLAVPEPADVDFQKGAVAIVDRTLYCRIAGGSAGRDYQFVWTAFDTDGNEWTRTGLLLVASTS